MRSIERIVEIFRLETYTLWVNVCIEFRFTGMWVSVPGKRG